MAINTEVQNITDLAQKAAGGDTSARQNLSNMGVQNVDTYIKGFSPATIPPPSTPSPYNTNDFNVPAKNTYNSSYLAPTNTVSDLLKMRKQYEDNVLQYTTPSSYELGLQKQLNSIKQLSRQAQLDLSRTNEQLDTSPGLTRDVSQNWISDTGRRFARTLSDLGVAQSGAADQLSVAQDLRNSQLKGAEFLYNSYKDVATPVSVGAGNSLVNPYTGEVSYGGASAYTDKQAQDTYFNLAQTYPDANIPAYDTRLSPQQNLQVAQQYTQASPYFQTKQNSYSAIPLPDGTYAFMDKKNGTVFNGSGQVIGNLGGMGTGFSNPIVTPEGAASFSANKDSLATQTKYLDTVERATNVANANFDSLLKFMKDNNINQSGVPIINQINNKVKGGLIDPGAVATYLSSIITLRNEYAQVLSKGGEVTDSIRSEANTVIPDSLSPSQLETLKNRIQMETKTALQEAKGQINSIKQRLTPQSSGTVNLDDAKFIW